MSTQVIGVSLPKELIKKIDSERGLIPRSKYIVQGLELAYRFYKGDSKMIQSEVVSDATRITRILNKHMAEDPECTHSINEIAREIFQT